MRQPITDFDYDRDGIKTPRDITTFVADWRFAVESGVYRAEVDADGDGENLPQDVAYFANGWAAWNVPSNRLGFGWTDLSPVPGAVVIDVPYDIGIHRLWYWYYQLRENFPDQLRFATAGTWRRVDLNGLNNQGLPNAPLIIKSSGDGGPSFRPTGTDIDGQHLAQIMSDPAEGSPPPIGRGHGGSDGNGSDGNTIIAHIEVVSSSMWGSHGIDWQGGPDWPDSECSKNVRIEGCIAHHFAQGFALQGIDYLTVYRCSLYENSDEGIGLPVGANMFVGQCNHTRVEDCVFDLGGAHAPGLYSQNYYLQFSCGPDNVILYSLFSRAGSHGLHGRSPVDVTGCVFWNNSENQLGYQDVWVADDGTPGVFGRWQDCVFLEGKNINARDGFERGIGVLVTDTRAINPPSIDRCIFAHKLEGPGAALDFDPYSGTSIRGCRVKGCIVFNWSPCVVVFPPGGTSVCENIHIEACDFIDTEGGDLVDVFDLVAATFTGNRYYSTRPDCFIVAGVRHDFAWWQTNVDPEGRWALPDYPDPNRSMDTFAQGAGFGNAVELMKTLHRMCFYNWDDRLRPRKIADHIRAGFGLGPI